jgi:4a-hydroxytetrahydrobiopterin dehydratase
LTIRTTSEVILMAPEVELKSKHCKPCEGMTSPLKEERVRALLTQVPDWTSDGKEIVRIFEFKNHYRTMAFVNAVAFISHREDHHPAMEVGYKICKVRYPTHAVGGLSENDFI